MENKPENSSESLWRGKLSSTERARLSAQPDLAAEARLTDALAKLSDVSVPSNFTARVLDAVDREERLASRTSARRWTWRSLFPRLTVAAAVLIFAGLSIQRHETTSHHRQLARTVAMLASTQSRPSVDVLENLDAIQRMSQSAHADGDLLADLQ